MGVATRSGGLLGSYCVGNFGGGFSRSSSNGISFSSERLAGLIGRGGSGGAKRVGCSCSNLTAAVSGVMVGRCFT